MEHSSELSHLRGEEAGVLILQFHSSLTEDSTRSIRSQALLACPAHRPRKSSQAKICSYLDQDTVQVCTRTVNVKSIQVGFSGIC